MWLLPKQSKNSILNQFRWRDMCLAKINLIFQEYNEDAFAYVYHFGNLFDQEE